MRHTSYVIRHIAERFSPGFRRYFANTSWLLLGQVLRTVITLSIGIYVARYLGAGNYGLLSYAGSFVALFSAIATLGLDSIVVRDLVRDEKERDELLGTAFFLKGMGAFLRLGIIALAIRFTTSDSITNVIMFLIASAAIFRSFDVIGFYFQSRVLSKYTVYCGIASVVFSSVIKIFLIYFGAGLVYFAATVLIESMILSLGLTLIYAKQRVSIFRWKIKLNLAKRLLSDSWPLILTGMSVSIYMRIDQVMIKEMLNAEAVGNYAVAVRLSEVWYFIPMLIARSVFPAIINAKNMGDRLYYKRFEQLYALMTWSAVGIALPVTFLADYIIALLFGAQYRYAAGVLKIYIWAGVFVSLGVASGRYLVSENYTKISFFRTLFGMVVNVGLNIILIPRYGITGAATATVISYFVATFFIALIPKTSKQAVLMLRSANPFHILAINKKV